MTDTVDKLFRRLKREGRQEGQVIDHSLIDRTLREIGAGYRPGLIGWIKGDRNRWRRLLDLEDQINAAALSMDEVTLIETLSGYQRFFEKMLIEYGQGYGLKRPSYDDGKDENPPIAHPPPWGCSPAEKGQLKMRIQHQK